MPGSDRAPAVEALTRLTQIRAMLVAALGSEALFSLVNTRLVLNTGTDLGAVRPEDDANAELVSKVLGALEAMGYSPAALAMVARRTKT